jgi:hypothetical protein
MPSVEGRYYKKQNKSGSLEERNKVRDWQVSIWISGSVGGMEVYKAVECVRYRESIGW